MDSILGSHHDLFRPGLGTTNGYKVKVIVEAGAQSRFGKAHTTPYAPRDEAEEELMSQEGEGIIEPMHSLQIGLPNC